MPKGRPQTKSVNFDKVQSFLPDIKPAEYTKTDGNVRYLDGEELTRPFDFPNASRKVLLVFLVVAALIGAFVVFQVFDKVFGEPARAQADAEANLTREVSYDWPTLSSLMALDDVSILDGFENSGFTIYDRTDDAEHAAGGFDVIKLPSDVSLADAGVMYLEGISNLSAANAAKLLKGSWTLTVNRNDYVDMNLKYADFESGSVEAAIQTALNEQGLANSILDDSGVDDAGNTFQSGAVETENGTYNWRISAIPLSSVYDIDGFPDTAVYIGIRMTEQA